MKSPSGVHVASRTSEPTLTPMRMSFDDTKLDPSDRQAVTPGIKTALRSLHVNLGHPTNDDLTRCLAPGGGSRVPQRAVKCLRCSTCERMSCARSHRPSRIPTNGERFNERLFVDLCDLVDVRGNRHWWLVAVPSHESQAVAKKIFKQWIRRADLLTYWCATESEAWELLRCSLKKLSVSGTQVQTTAAFSLWEKGGVEQRIATIKEVAGKTIVQHQVPCQLSPTRLPNHLAYGVYWRSSAGELLAVRRWRRRPVDALAHRVLHEGDVSIMVSSSPDFGERTTRSEVRRVEVSNRQQTSKTILQHKVAGRRAMSVVSYEVAHALNQRAGRLDIHPHKFFWPANEGPRTTDGTQVRSFPIRRWWTKETSWQDVSSFGRQRERPWKNMLLRKRSEEQLPHVPGQ